jgi:hypothetical protein
MRLSAEEFAGREPRLLYIAKKLREAKHVEALLTGRGIDYLVETDTYLGGMVFVSERVGAFFYVDEPCWPQAAAALRGQGFRIAEQP